MSDIFISYAREDLDRARQLAVALEARGWSVFWDQTIPPGKTWHEVIGTALHEALCVIVVWSEVSIYKDWVREEAEEGKAHKILVPVLFDKVTPPIGFRSIQAASLVDWDGRQTTDGFQQLVSAVAGITGPTKGLARGRAPGALGDQDIQPLVVVAIRSPNPDPLWDRVFQWIYEQEGIDPYQLRPGETIDSRSQAEPCHGYLIACDAAAVDDGSPREVIEQCRQVQLREKNAARRPPVALVYWPPPSPSWAKLLRSTPLKLHRVLGDEPEKLSVFFAEVRKVAQ